MFKAISASPVVRICRRWLVEFKTATGDSFWHSTDYLAALKMNAVITVSIYDLAIYSLLPFASRLAFWMAYIWCLLPVGQRFHRRSRLATVTANATRLG
jgi:hypothetical protein